MTAEQTRITNAFYLAFVLWREARGEGRDGKIALAFTIMNRVENPKWWGTDIVSVCIKPWQYSSLTDPKDPNLSKYPGEGPVWDECIDVALSVMDKKVSNPVSGADSYYSISMKEPPPWAAKTLFVSQIGNHRFYNTDGDHPENLKVV